MDGGKHHHQSPVNCVLRIASMLQCQLAGVTLSKAFHTSQLYPCSWLVELYGLVLEFCLCYHAGALLNAFQSREKSSITAKWSSQTAEYDVLGTNRLPAATLYLCAGEIVRTCL